MAIGIADTGIIQKYGELPAGKIVAQRDVINGDSVAEDYHGHGTQMSMLAAARTDNRYGMAEAGFNASIAMCKSMSYDPATGTRFGSAAQMAKCIDWLQKRPNVKVISLSVSLKAGRTSRVIASEIKESQERYKKLVVSAVGNDGAYVTTFVPASLPGVVGVGSNDGRTARSSFSNRGPMVDIMAPGNGVVSFVNPDEKPVFGFGTSYSTPTVAGCAALLFAEGYNADQIRSRILRTATNMGVSGRDDSTGYGLMNCGNAISD